MLIINKCEPNYIATRAVSVADGGGSGRSTTSTTPKATSGCGGVSTSTRTTSSGCSGVRTSTTSTSTDSSNIDWPATYEKRRSEESTCNSEIYKYENLIKDCKEVKNKCNAQKQICEDIKSYYTTAKGKIDAIGKIGGKSLDSGDMFSSGVSAFSDYATVLKDIMDQCDKKLPKLEEDLQKWKDKLKNVNSIYVYYK